MVPDEDEKLTRGGSLREETNLSFCARRLRSAALRRIYPGASRGVRGRRCQAHGRRPEEGRGRRGETPGEQKAWKRIGPATRIIPDAGERTHVRGTPWSRTEVSFHEVGRIEATGDDDPDGSGRGPVFHETALVNGRRGATPRGERIHVRGSL